MRRARIRLLLLPLLLSLPLRAVAAPLDADVEGNLRYGQGATFSLAAAALPGELSAQLLPCGPGQVVAIWSSARCEARAWSRLTLSADAVRERDFGVLPAGWHVFGAGCIDGDALPDLGLVRFDGDGDSRRFSVAVARGRASGFDWPKPAQAKVLVREARAAFFTLADADGDGRLDLLYHSAPHGGLFKTSVHLARGLGDGGFADGAMLVENPQGGTELAVGDFDGDGDLDIAYGPDDDVRDEGQAVILLQGPKDWRFRHDIDIRPGCETFSADSCSGHAEAADVDEDGRLDLILRAVDLRAKTWETRWHRNLGDRFAAAGTLIAKGRFGDREAPRLYIAPGPAAAPLPPRQLSDAARSLALIDLCADDLELRLAALATLRGDLIAQHIGLRALCAGGTDAARVSRLVAALRSDDSRARDAATTALRGLGDLAEPALRAAQRREDDPEARFRVALLLDALEGDGARGDDPRARLIRGVTALLSRGPHSEDALRWVAQSASRGAARRCAESVLRGWGRAESGD